MSWRSRFCVPSLTCAFLSACGGSGPEFSTAGLRAPPTFCAVDPDSVATAERIADIDGPSACRVDNAWQLHRIAGVKLVNGAVVNCGMVSPLNDWLGRTVEPAAQSSFGEPIVAVDVAASYACRARNGERGAKMSEHGFGNAIDIAAFTLASGRTVTVKEGWTGAADERRFLSEVRADACRDFHTVLGPGSDAHHRDHIHLDLANRASGHYCR